MRLTNLDMIKIEEAWRKKARTIGESGDYTSAASTDRELANDIVKDLESLANKILRLGRMGVDTSIEIEGDQ